MDHLARPSSWATSFFLLHAILGVGEKRFGQVVTPTSRSLTDTSGGYNILGASFSYHTLRPSQPTVLRFPLRALPGLRLTILNKPLTITYVKRPTTIELSPYHSASIESL
jgi:hypothetical protein